MSTTSIINMLKSCLLQKHKLDSNENNNNNKMDHIEAPSSLLSSSSTTTCCYRKSLLFSLIMVYISVITLTSQQSLASPAPPGTSGNQPVINSRQQVSPFLFSRDSSGHQMSHVPNIPPTMILSQQTLFKEQQQQPQSQQQLTIHTHMNQYTRATHDILLELRQQMLTKSFSFDNHFKQLLRESKVNLHNMFADTYGIIYESNTEIFTVMYESLEQYYITGQVKIGDSLENFFKRLYQKIFQFLNSNLVFDPVYLECATSQLEHLKPFQDMPDRLIKGIKHAFIAARTFKQALNNGMDIIKSIISLVPSTQCTHLINDKLLLNANQAAESSVVRAPCAKFCEEVIGRCIGKVYLDELHTNWKAYVQSLADLAKKLSTSYNMETIIAPLDVQISEAIMNFQENGTNITQHVFRACGQPPIKMDPIASHNPINRIKRGSNSAFTSSSVISHGRHLSMAPQASNSQGMNWHTDDWRSPTNKQTSSLSNQRSSSIHQFDDLMEQKSPTIVLINVIKDYMLSTKSIWQQLPNSVCTSNYTRTVNRFSGCFQEAFAISDINSDMRYRNEMQQQINRLASVRIRIDSALAGDEVDWNNDTPGSKIVVTTPSHTVTTPEPTDDETEPIDDPDDSIEGSGEEPSDPSDDTTTEQEDWVDYTTDPPTTPLIDGNTIDDPLPPNGGLYITPSDQAGAQKSSQTSSNPYVISIVLASLASHFVSLYILRLTNFPLS